jgi:hypothetical protein
MIIPFNDIYSIARQRDNEIRQTMTPACGPRRPQPERRRTIAAYLRGWLGSRPALLDSARVQGTETGR